MEWVVPAEPPDLAADEVHVWRVSLACEPEAEAALRSLLTADERARADRFYFARHKRRFTAARGALRLLLGRYVGKDPAGIRFSYGPQGKPALAAEAALTFNVSHSEELAVIAFGWKRPLGVDVEYKRPMPDADDIARTHFAPAEYAQFRALPPSAQTDAFFNCWTRKEAFIKAIGEGLSYPLDQFEVTLRPGEAARLVCVQGEAAIARRWRLAALHPAPDFVGALLAAGQAWRLRLFGFGEWEIGDWGLEIGD